MRKILAVALATLATACGGGGTKEKPIQYGAPQAPTATEQAATANAAATLEAATLQNSLAYQPSTEPTAGAAGLGDQLVADLGGYAVAAKMPTASSAKAARTAVRQAFSTGGLDPACVTTTQAGAVTTVTWGAGAPCHIVVTETDPTTGATTMTMTVDVAGTLTWNSDTRETTWSITEPMAMTMISGADTIDLSGTAHLSGSTKVTDATIVARTSSSADVYTTARNITMHEAIETTLAADLGYQPSPFCITSGTLTVEQHWPVRPMGATAQDLPNQGWSFTWHGCGAFDVQHGS